MKDVIDSRVHRFDLGFRFLDGANETERAERDRSAYRNYRDLLPFAPQFFRDGFDRYRALLATVDADDLCAEQFIDGEARRFQSFMRHSGRIQNQDAAQPEPRAHGRSHPRMVRFHASAGDHHSGAVGHGLGQHVFQLANLVAAESWAGVIVALDEDARGIAAQSLTESRRFFDRRRIDAVIQSRYRIEALYRPLN